MIDLYSHTKTKVSIICNMTTVKVTSQMYEKGINVKESICIFSKKTRTMNMNRNDLKIILPKKKKEKFSSHE